MTYHPHSHLAEFQKEALLHTHIPLSVIAVLCHCEYEHELKLVWKRLLEDQLIANPESVHLLAAKHQIDLPLPPKLSFIEKGKRLVNKHVLRS